MYKKILLYTSNQKGMALVATLIIVLAISTFAIAMLSMTTSDIKLSALQEASKETFYIAESGIDRAIGFLEDLGNPDYQVPFNPFTDDNGGWPKIGSGEYQVFIKSSSPLSYTIISEGRKPWNNASGKISTKIKSEVILDNFAVFAYFSDQELFPSHIDSSYGGTKIWFFGEDTIEGRLHSNDRLAMAGTPTFYGAVTSAYINKATGDKSWEKYDSKTNPNFYGKPPYQGGVDKIPLPTYRNISELGDPNSLQRIAGSPASQDDVNKESNGVYIANSGTQVTNGIWVKGSVDTLSFGVDNKNNPETTIIQGGKTTVITTVETPIAIGGVTYPAGTTLIRENSIVKKSLNGFTNGVIFVNGEIKSLQAPAATKGVKGKVTLASNNHITIGSDILYNTRVNDPNCFKTTEDNPFPDIPDSLGLISEGDIKIKKATASANLEINAIMMALGTSFFYEGWKDTQKGKLTVYGSFIQKQRGPVGMFSSTGKSYGYSKDYHFDTRMDVNNPKFGQVLPPYFPTTGKYIPLYWEEIL